MCVCVYTYINIIYNWAMNYIISFLVKLHFLTVNSHLICLVFQKTFLSLIHSQTPPELIKPSSTCSSTPDSLPWKTAPGILCGLFLLPSGLLSRPAEASLHHHPRNSVSLPNWTDPLRATHLSSTLHLPSYWFTPLFVEHILQPLPDKVCTWAKLEPLYGWKLLFLHTGWKFG